MAQEQQTKPGRRAAIVFSFLVTFILLSSMYLVWMNQSVSQEKMRYGYMAASEGDHLMMTVDCIMARTTTLKALVRDHEGNTDFFDSVAGTVYDDVLMETGVPLKNLALAPHGVVSHVYPFKGNEALVGFDFMDLSKKGNVEAREAYLKGDTVLTNPFELIQGGIGMAGRTPVLLMVNDEPVFWGLVTVTIDFDKLIETSALRNFTEMGIDYKLRCIDDEGMAHDLKGPETIGEDALTHRFTVRNLTWELSVRPKDGWVSPTQHVIAACLCLLLAFFDAQFVNLFFRLRESNVALKHLSEHDVMTGIRNRRALDADVEGFLKDPPAEYCVLVADVNGLKEVNDAFGHKAGDEMIVGAAKCLRQAFGENSTVYRIGGDEFFVFMTGGPETMEQCLTDLNRLAAAWKGTLTDTMSISCGMACGRDCPDIRAAAREADKRMYECKSNYYRSTGKDRRK